MILAHPQNCVACHLCEGACSFQHGGAFQGRVAGAEHVQDRGVVQAMIRRRTDVSRWRHMLHGKRINYGMLAFESAKR